MDGPGDAHGQALTDVTTAASVAADAQTSLDTAVARARHNGATWSQIAEALQITRQSVHQRYRRLRYDPASGRAWHEPPLPLQTPPPNA